MRSRDRPTSKRHGQIQDRSSRQLAELSGVSQEEIDLLENGKGDPTLRTLKQLATALGKNLQLFFI